MTLASASESAIAGLNKAPETRKKIQTLTTREMPNPNAMNSKFDVLMKVAPPSMGGVAAARLATWAALNAMKRNMVVPKYSPAYFIREHMISIYHCHQLVPELLLFSSHVRLDLFFLLLIKESLC
jgi:hypothetical protein